MDSKVSYFMFGLAQSWAESLLQYKTICLPSTVNSLKVTELLWYMYMSGNKEIMVRKPDMPPVFRKSMALWEKVDKQT